MCGFARTTSAARALQRVAGRRFVIMFASVSRFVVAAALAVSFAASGCAGIHTLPKERAAADLSCSTDDVQVTTAFTEQHAEGCHRSADYVWRCTDGGTCGWVQEGATIVVEREKPATPGRAVAKK
jgi:hypothetical protein